MYIAFEVKFIINRQNMRMLIMINGENKMNMKRDSVRIIMIILDLHGAIIVSRTVVLFEYEKPLLSRVGKW